MALETLPLSTAKDFDNDAAAVDMADEATHEVRDGTHQRLSAKLSNARVMNTQQGTANKSKSKSLASESFYSYNGHGDSTNLTQQSGTTLAVTATYEYDAFGNINSGTGSVYNPYLYDGEYYDTETGYIYLRNRYYDPATGRFIQQDPAKDGLNWYTYCNNDPVNYVDPLGLKITCVKEDSGQIIELLNELSGYSLEMIYNEETGEIDYKKKFDSQKHVGQTLVTDLLSLPEIVNVNIGVDQNGNTNTKWASYVDPDDKIQIYIDPDNKTGEGLFKTIVQDEEGNPLEEEILAYIVFGHELIHAWREVNGLFDDNVEQGITPYDYSHNQKASPAEEMKTMGINYLDSKGNQMQNYSTYTGIISENGLRLENGLKIRISYTGEYLK